VLCARIKVLGGQVNNVGRRRDSREPTRFCSANAYFQFPSQVAINITKKGTDLVPPGFLRNKLVTNSGRGELVSRFSICGEHSTEKGNYVGITTEELYK